jgi:hypothetical protein
VGGLQHLAPKLWLPLDPRCTGLGTGTAENRIG